MIGAKPHVERQVIFPIVALEVAVMQLVEIRSSWNTSVSLDGKRLEPNVPLCWGERGVMCVHQHVDWVRGHNPVNQDATEVEDVLNRVHGQSGPWSDVDIFVMEVVPSFVEQPPMQETMGPVEVEQSPHLDAAEQDDKVDRFLSQVDVGNHLVGIGPYHQDFVSRPDCTAANTTPENIVAKLIIPKELALSGSHPV